MDQEINKIDTETEKLKSDFEKLFITQRKFFDRFHNLEKMSVTEKSAVTRAYLEAITHELSEIRALLPWKFWKQYKDFAIDSEELRYEIVDVFVFLMNLAFIWGMDYDTFFRYVYSKQMVNVERQENPNLGYISKKESKDEGQDKNE